MTLLQRAIEVFKAPSVDRLPQTAGLNLSPLGSMASASGLVAQMSAMGHMSAMGQVSWLFTCVDLIASAVAASQWRLYQVSGTEPRELAKHPLLDLWHSVNPFTTTYDYLYAEAQYDCLVGEMWTVVLRDNLGRPAELWPVRPDRMRPVPSRDDYIAGYIYTAPDGIEKVPLPLEDVLFSRVPNPMDSYRGMGPVQALLVDLGSERAAAEWTRMFFRNSAEPGGIIEVDESVSDEEFTKMVTRWREQHQGGSNAHRVAFIEKAHWKDRIFTQRDMQFEQLRKLNRDIILGAFRVHAHMVGISESVNRANAEAAEVMFGRWVVRPRLERIKATSNERLCPLFGDNLAFDYIDPTPADRQYDLEVGDRGWRGGLLTRDEARRRVGERPAASGGDEYISLPALGGLTPVGASVKALARPKGRSATEDAMDAAWRRRLGAELARVLARVDELESGQLATERGILSAIGAIVGVQPKGIARAKLELADIMALDWDWWARYGDEVIAELTAAFGTAIASAMPGLEPASLQRYAAEYARQRGAMLLRLDGEANLVNLTRQRVRDLVAQTLEEGQSLGQLRKLLREDFAFSPLRAERIARTETATALGQGNMQAAHLDGRQEKRWYTQGDDRVSDICRRNEAAGWISISDPFPAGMDTIPGHVDCRCNVAYRHTPVAEAEAYDARCPNPGCNKLLLRGAHAAAERYCSRCKATVTC